MRARIISREGFSLKKVSLIITVRIGTKVTRHGGDEVMKTANPSFNRHWEYLERFHRQAPFPKGFSLAVKEKPKLTKKEWER